MILKGKQRRGGNDLALHLSNEVDNERVHIAETRGMVADNLYDGFREWQLICDQSNAKDAFYSLSINPDPTQREWSKKEWTRAIDHIEERLGLSDQPRAIVFHEKTGESDGKQRKHAHIVWCRIKTDNGQIRAVHLGHDYYKLKSCARELAKEFGLELSYENNGKSKKSDAFDHATSQGKNRDPHTAKTRKELLTRLWREHPTPQGFVDAAGVHGFTIARGERRAFVIVDSDNQVHALARQLDGVNTKGVKARLGDPDQYPSIEQAKDEQKVRKSMGEKPPVLRNDLSYAQRQMQKLRRMAQRADRLHHTRRDMLAKHKNEMTARHNAAWRDLNTKHRRMESLRLRKRAEKKPTGMVKSVCDAIGITNLMSWLDSIEDHKRAQHHAKQCAALKDAHRIEAARLHRKYQSLAKLESREAQTLNRLAQKLGMHARLQELSKTHPPPTHHKAAGFRLA